jgi:hypothetical protein
LAFYFLSRSIKFEEKLVQGNKDNCQIMTPKSIETSSDDKKRMRIKIEKVKSNLKKIKCFPQLPTKAIAPTRI